MAPAYRSLYFCDLGSFHYVLQTLCGQVYARRSFFLAKNTSPEILNMSFYDLVTREASYIDLLFLLLSLNQEGYWLRAAIRLIDTSGI